MSLDWFYTAIAWVMKEWHALFSTFLDPASGITWALSIVFLVVTVRIVLFRFFIKQVKSQRAMQEIQPEIQKLKKQYGADRQGFSAAVMALQKERGVNPLAGCLPIVPQIPVFIALFHVLRRLAPGKPGLYSWSDELTNQAATAKLFGAPISASLQMTGSKEQAILAIPGVTYTNIRIVAAVLIVIMCVTSYLTQRQIITRSGPVDGQAAMVQRLMLYGMPLGLLVSSSFFPIGVLLYWFTNNLWTMGQQFYILKKMPPPGSPAAKAKVAADKPAIDPRSLAPRPGAKPVRNRSGRPGTPTTPAADGTATSGTAAGATAIGATASDAATAADPPAVADPASAGAGSAGAGSAGAGATAIQGPAPGGNRSGTNGSGTNDSGVDGSGSNGSVVRGSGASGPAVTGAGSARAGHGGGSRAKRKRR